MIPANIQSTYETRKKAYEIKSTENKLYDKQIGEATTKVEELRKKQGIAKEANIFLENLANSRRSGLKGKIEEVLTEAVKIIYGETYSVEFEYTTKNNRSHLDVLLVKLTPKGIVKRTLEGFGGGVADTIAVPLRLLILINSRQADKICVLDEAWKHMDEGRIDTVAAFLKSISEKLGIQIFMASHWEVMQTVADSVWEMKDQNGTCAIKKLK